MVLGKFHSEWAMNIFLFSSFWKLIGPQTQRDHNPGWNKKSSHLRLSSIAFFPTLPFHLLLYLCSETQSVNESLFSPTSFPFPFFILIIPPSEPQGSEYLTRQQVHMETSRSHGGFSTGLGVTAILNPRVSILCFLVVFRAGCSVLPTEAARLCLG
jgi:hypothetical protein